jgi:hypothetical protein
MKAADVTATLKMALDAAGLDKAKVLHRPRLLSDNGSSYISDESTGRMRSASVRVDRARERQRDHRGSY